MLFSVEGTKASTVEAKLIKDGKALPLKEVDIVVSEDKITYKIKKPTRAQSGNYDLKLSNAQGEETKTIPINMQGMVLLSLQLSLGNAVRQIILNEQKKVFSVSNQGGMNTSSATCISRCSNFIY